jgi:hypothetical protein
MLEGNPCVPQISLAGLASLVFPPPATKQVLRAFWLQAFPRGSPSIPGAYNPRAEMSQDSPRHRLVVHEGDGPDPSPPFPGRTIHDSGGREGKPQVALVSRPEGDGRGDASNLYSLCSCSTGDRSRASPSASPPRSSPLLDFPSPADPVCTRNSPVGMCFPGFYFPDNQTKPLRALVTGDPPGIPGWMHTRGGILSFPRLPRDRFPHLERSGRNSPAVPRATVRRLSLQAPPPGDRERRLCQNHPHPSGEHKRRIHQALPSLASQRGSSPAGPHRRPRCHQIRR